VGEAVEAAASLGVEEEEGIVVVLDVVEEVEDEELVVVAGAELEAALES
jgi:hypothetical protein